MKNLIYDSNDAKQEILQNIDSYKGYIEAWENVKKLYKKDGSDFKNLQQNFDGLKVIQKDYCFSSQKELWVYGKTPNGCYIKDFINNYNIVRHMDKNEIKNKSQIISLGNGTADFYLYTPSEIMEQIDNHLNKYRENLKKYEVALDNVENVFEKLEKINNQIEETKNNFPESASIIYYYFSKNRF